MGQHGEGLSSHEPNRGARDDEASPTSDLRRQIADLDTQLHLEGLRSGELQRDVRKLSRWLDTLGTLSDKSLASRKRELSRKLERAVERLHRPSSAVERAATKLGPPGLARRSARLAQVTKPEGSEAKARRVIATYRSWRKRKDRPSPTRLSAAFASGVSREITTAEASAAYRDYLIGVEWLADDRDRGAGTGPGTGGGVGSDPAQTTTVSAVILPEGRIAAGDARLREATTEALSKVGIPIIEDPAAARGSEWLIAVQPGDLVDARLLSALAAAAPDAAVVVFDDDVVTEAGEPLSGRLKPGFQPDLLLEHNYVGNAVAFRRESVTGRGLVPSLADDAVRDLLLALSDSGATVQKIDHVLLHQLVDRAAHGASDPAARRAPDLAFTESVLARRADQLARAHVTAHAYAVSSGTHVRYRSDDEPLASIIIPFRDGVEMLRPCLDSILALTTYPNYEVLLVDNQSKEQETLDYLAGIHDPQVRVVTYDHPFNYSKVNNFAVDHARGTVLVFLNNDTEVLTATWLEDMIGSAMRPQIGAVGAFLYFPDGSIQHAGVVMGVVGHCDHIFAHAHEAFLPHDYVKHTRDCLAVTAACLAVRKDTFDEVGRFDERYLVICNDVDLGMKIHATGRRNVVLPYVRLFHKESATRDATEVDVIDIKLLVERATSLDIERDPFYHPGANYPRANLVPTRTLAAPIDVEKMIDYFEHPGRRPAALKRLPGATLARSFDVSDRELAASRAITEVQQARDDRSLASIAWFVRAESTWWTEAERAGLHWADYLDRTLGSQHTFVLCGDLPRARDLTQVRRRLADAHPCLARARLVVLEDPSAADLLPFHDASVSLDWHAAFSLLRYNATSAKYYLIDEGGYGFTTHPGEPALRDASRRLGIPMISVAVERQGGVAGGTAPDHQMGPLIDPSLYSPSEDHDARDPDGPVQIIFPTSPSDPHFALGLLALAQVRKQNPEMVRVTSVGGAFEPEKFGAGFVERRGSPASEAELAALYRSSDIALVLSDAGAPPAGLIRSMACGLAVVSGRDGSFGGVLDDGRNCLQSELLLTPLVETLSTLVTDATLRKQLAKNAPTRVSLAAPEQRLAAATAFVTGGNAS